jgi:hypothetical protein
MEEPQHAGVTKIILHTKKEKCVKTKQADPQLLV